MDSVLLRSGNQNTQVSMGKGDMEVVNVNNIFMLVSQNTHAIWGKYYCCQIASAFDSHLLLSCTNAPPSTLFIGGKGVSLSAYLNPTVVSPENNIFSTPVSGTVTPVRYNFVISVPPRHHSGGA